MSMRRIKLMAIRPGDDARRWSRSSPGATNRWRGGQFLRESLAADHDPPKTSDGPDVEKLPGLTERTAVRRVDVASRLSGGGA